MTDEQKIQAFLDHIIEAARIQAQLKPPARDQTAAAELVRHKREAASLLTRLFVPFMVP